MAPIKVGSAYAEFFLKRDDVAAGVNEIVTSLGTLKTTAADTAKSAQAVARANQQILKSVQALKQELSALDPFKALTEQAQASYMAVVGNSIIPDLRTETVAEVAQLRKQLEQARAFDPLERAAAEAADKSAQELEQLQERAAQAQAKIDSIGISRDQLRGVINNEGQVRDSLRQYNDALAATRKTDRFGKVSDTDAQSRRFEEINLAAEAGTRASMTDEIEELKAMAAEAREAYLELDQLELKIRNLETERKGQKQDSAAGERLAAIAALEQYDQAVERVSASLAEMQRIEDRADQLNTRYKNLATAAEQAADGTKQQYQAAYLAEAAQQQLLAVLDRYDRVSDEATAAELEQAEALERVKQAQEDLTAAQRQAEQQQRRTRSTSPEPADSAGPIRSAGGSRQSKAEELESIRAQRQAEKLAAEERIQQLRAESSEKERQAAIQIEIERKLAAMEAARIAAQAQRDAAETAAAARRFEAEKRAATQAANAKIAADSRLEAARATAHTKAQATYLAAEKRTTGQVESAKLQSEAKIQAAQLQRLGRVEAAEIRAAERDRRAAERAERDKNKGSGPALPRTFAGFTANGLIELAGVFGVATTAAEAFQQAYNAIAEGNRLRGELDETRRSLGSLIDSQDRANRIFNEAAKFGDRYRFTTHEMTQALEALAPQIRNSNVETQKQLEITARLLSRSPGQGFDGAAFSIGELANLDTQSIVERFNIPRQAANRMKAEIQAGADVFEVLDRELNRLGVTSEILGQRLDGPAGASRDLAKAAEDLKISLAGLFEGDIANGQRWSAELATSVSRGLDTLTFLRKNASWRDFIPSWEQMQEASASRTPGADPLTAGIESIAEIFAVGAKNAAARVQESAVIIDPALKQIGDQTTVLGNKLAEGKLNLNQYAEALSKLGQAGQNVPSADTFGLVSGTSSLPDAERITRLQDALAAFQRAIGERPEIAAQYIPQMQAIAAEIDRLKAKAPIVITIEMRQQFMSQAVGIMEQAASRAEAVNTQIADLDRQYSQRQGELASQAASAWSSYLQQRSRAAAQFAQQQARAARDFGQQQARSARDFAAQERKAEEEHARRATEIRQKLADDLAKIERDKNQRLRELQGQADVERTRDREDYDEERQRLLAEGRIFEAEQLRRQYEKEQRRKAEDLARERSGTVDQADQQTTETTTAADKQIADEAAQFARQRAERRAQYEQQRADAAAAYAQQRADAAAAFAQQQAEAAQAAQQQQAQIRAQQAQESQNYKDGRQKLLADLATYLAEQKAKLEEAQQNIIEAQRRGVDLALIEQEKSLEKSKQKLQGTLDKLGPVLTQAGGKAATAYMREFAAALAFGATQVDQALRGTEDRLRPRSPIRRGPLRDLESAGRKAGDQYISGLAGGFNATKIDPALADVRERLQLQANAANQAGTQTQQRAGDEARQRQPIQLVINVAGPTLDGQQLTAHLAQQTAELLTDDLAIQIQIADATNQPTLQQAAFRQV